MGRKHRGELAAERLPRAPPLSGGRRLPRGNACESRSSPSSPLPRPHSRAGARLRLLPDAAVRAARKDDDACQRVAHHGGPVEEGAPEARPDGEAVGGERSLRAPQLELVVDLLVLPHGEHYQPVVLVRRDDDAALVGGDVAGLVAEGGLRPELNPQGDQGG